MEGKTVERQQSMDPFEAAMEDQHHHDSPPRYHPTFHADPNPNPNPPDDDDYDEDEENANQNPGDAALNATKGDPYVSTNPAAANAAAASAAWPSSSRAGHGGKQREEEDEEEEENVDVELEKFPSSGDPHKMAKMQAILSRFSEEQMSRYESFRRAGFQKSNMKRLLASITGTQKISIPLTIVVSGIAKMFVGELVETARMVMAKREESGPIRPCHIREAFRRLKLEGKVPKRSVPRLFR